MPIEEEEEDMDNFDVERYIESSLAQNQQRIKRIEEQGINDRIMIERELIKNLTKNAQNSPANSSQQHPIPQSSSARKSQPYSNRTSPEKHSSAKREEQ